MDIIAGVLLAMCSCLCSAGSTRQGPMCDSGDPNDPPLPGIQLTSLCVTNKSLTVAYRIENQSQHDIWVYSGSGGHVTQAPHVFVLDRHNTLTIAGSLCWPEERLPVSEGARYVRVPRGQTCEHELEVALPVKCHTVSRGDEAPTGRLYAQQLRLIIGFYQDLPRMVRQVLAEAEGLAADSPESVVTFLSTTHNRVAVLAWDLWKLNARNTMLEPTSKHVNVPDIWCRLRDEHLLRVCLDGIKIPCEFAGVRRASPGFSAASDDSKD